MQISYIRFLFFLTAFFQASVIFASPLEVNGIHLGQSFSEIKKSYSDISVDWKMNSDCKTCGTCRWKLNVPAYDKFLIDVDMGTGKVTSILTKNKTDSIPSGVLWALDKYGRPDYKTCYASL